MCRNNRSVIKRSGYTLIEVLVALTIMAVGILGIMTGFSLCNRAASRQARLAEAVTIAERELELARMTPAGGFLSQTKTAGPYSWQVAFTEKEYHLAVASVSVKWTQRGEPQVYNLSQVFEPRN